MNWESCRGHVQQNLFVFNEFPKFYFVILLHLPSRLIIHYYLVDAKPPSSLWIIPLRGVFPLLRNTALMFTHNTILRDLWWKRNHKCLPLGFTKTDIKHFWHTKYFLSHQPDCRQASCLQKICRATVSVQYVCIREHPQFRFLSVSSSFITIILLHHLCLFSVGTVIFLAVSE